MRQPLHDIALRAASLYEHLELEADSAPDSDGWKRLSEWRHHDANIDSEAFVRRLAWLGLDEEAAAAALSTPPPGPGPWVRTLERACQRARTTHLPGLDAHAVVDPVHPLPFQELLLPFVDEAASRIAPETRDQLSPRAWRTLRRLLLARLSSTACLTLQGAFEAGRPAGTGLLSHLLTTRSGPPPRDRYRSFVRDHLSTGLLDLFGAYPVLGRLLATASDLWVHNVGLLLDRLRADRDVLSALTGHAFERVEEVHGNLSDPHRHGAVVLILDLGGHRVVYKPRDLSVDEAFEHLSRWLDARGIRVRVPRVLAQDGYGWMEWIAQAPVGDAEAAVRFYRNAGGLLAVLWALGTTDCHRENLIAVGEDLVLIDLESVLHHANPPTADERGPQRELADSVVRVGLLPQWSFLGNDYRHAHDDSGLGGVEPSAGKHPTWKSVNTDHMVRGYEERKGQLERNVPLLDGVPLRPEDHVDAFVDGFEKAYSLLLCHRSDLLASDGPLARFHGLAIRSVLRDTRIYSSLHWNALEPEALRCGFHRSLILERLARGALQIPEERLPGRLLQAELEAMERLDVPYFASRTDSDALGVDEALHIPGFFAGPSFDAMQTRLLGMGASHLDLQSRLIRATFEARAARVRPVLDRQPTLDAPLPSDEAMLHAAGEIAQALITRSIGGPDGSRTWIGLEFFPRAGRFQARPLGDDLYDGRLGVAVFLASYARISGDETAADHAREALTELRSRIRLHRTASRPARAHVARTSGLGAGSGLGSVLYGLTTCAGLLDDPTLLEEALEVASLVTDESIASDPHLDVLGGAAGAVLGLCALHEQTGSPLALERARRCGDHLVACRTSSHDHPPAWRTLGPRPQTGFSHGAAGIAFALLRLARHTREPAHVRAAMDGLAYERHLYCPAHGTWPDLRWKHSSSQGLNCWCNGGVGIGLARLGMMDLGFLDDALVHEVEIALAHRPKGLQSVDHPCCGNLGTVELLLEAGRQLQQPDLVQEGRDLAARVVARRNATGHYRLFTDASSDLVNPGFFQGLSGIGHGLLRAIAPARVPCVLLWAQGSAASAATHPHIEVHA